MECSNKWYLIWNVQTSDIWYGVLKHVIFDSKCLNKWYLIWNVQTSDIWYGVFKQVIFDMKYSNKWYLIWNVQPSDIWYGVFETHMFSYWNYLCIKQHFIQLKIQRNPFLPEKHIKNKKTKSKKNGIGKGYQYASKKERCIQWLIYYVFVANSHYPY